MLRQILTLVLTVVAAFGFFTFIWTSWLLAALCFLALCWTFRELVWKLDPMVYGEPGQKEA